jgi:hypothetical protein
VLKSTDGGNTWTWNDNGLPDNPFLTLAIDPQTPATVYAGSQSGVFKSTDGGNTWDLLPIVATLLALDPQTPTTLYGGGTYGGVVKSTDGGDSWSQTSDTGGWCCSVHALAIDPQTTTTLYNQNWGDVCHQMMGSLYCTRGPVGKSTDGGDTWGPLPIVATMLTIDPQTPSTLYAVADGVFKSTDGGSTWNAFGTGLPDLPVTALAIDPIEPRRVYAATEGRGVFAIEQGSSEVQQACAKVIRDSFTTFFKANLAAQQTCINKVNKGTGTPPCPDAKAAAAIAKAASKVDPVKLGRKCPAQVIPTLGLGGLCTYAANVDVLAMCIAAETEAAVDAVLAAEYSKPEAVLARTVQRCQAAVATATKQYATSRLRIFSSCLTQRDKATLTSCPDPGAQRKLTTAAAKVGRAITKKCSDAVVQTLNNTSFGGSCAMATTAAALASCEVAAHDAVIDDAMLNRLE